MRFKAALYRTQTRFCYFVLTWFEMSQNSSLTPHGLIWHQLFLHCGTLVQISRIMNCCFYPGNQLEPFRTELISSVL